MGEYEERVNLFLNGLKAKTHSKDNIGKLSPNDTSSNFLCTPEKKKTPDNSDNNSQSALYEAQENEKLMETSENHENILSCFFEKENLTESQNEPYDDIYYLSGKKTNRENINSIRSNMSPSFFEGCMNCSDKQINNNLMSSNLETKKVKLNQANKNQKKNITKKNKKEKKVMNIKWVKKNESNNPNNINENEIIFDSVLYPSQEDYININNQNDSPKITNGMSMKLEEKSDEEASKAITLTEIRKEDKKKKKVEKAYKPSPIRGVQRIKYENLYQNKIRQENDKDINMNFNIQLYVNKGKIIPKINPGNHGIISDGDDDEITSKQEDIKKKENCNNSKKIKPNTRKNRFIFKTERQNIYSKNSIISKAGIKENKSNQVPNLINIDLNKVNININQEQIKNCGEIKNTGIHIFEKEEHKEENKIIYTQQFIEISKKNEDKNNLPKLKRSVFSNYYQKINSLINEETLKLKKFNPKKIESITKKDNLPLYGSVMKELIPKISDNNEKLINDILNIYKGKEVSKLLEMNFSQCLKSFRENDWDKFEKEAKDKQINFYIQKKYKIVIDDMKSKQLNTELEKIKKFIHFRNTKEENQSNNIEIDKFKDKYYNVKDKEKFESFIQNIEIYKNLKFDYEHFSEKEKKNINNYIQSLKKLGEDFCPFFEKKKGKEEKNLYRFICKKFNYC